MSLHNLSFNPTLYTICLTIYLYRCSLQHEKKLKCGKPAAYIYGQICNDLIYYVYVVKLLSNVWENGIYMLIFQPHLPHIITNSWRPLHDLSLSKISFTKCLGPTSQILFISAGLEIQPVRLYVRLYGLISGLGI